MSTNRLANRGLEYCPMIDFILYAAASVYFIWSTLESASLGVLAAAARVPLLQSTSLFKSLDTAVRTVVLPSSVLRVASASVLSLLTYPVVSFLNAVVQAFVYWLALVGFAYLSVSQNEKAFQILCDQCTRVFAALKLHAPQQFEKLVGAGFALIASSSTTAHASVETSHGDDEQNDNDDNNNEPDDIATSEHDDLHDSNESAPAVARKK